MKNKRSKVMLAVLVFALVFASVSSFDSSRAYAQEGRGEKGRIGSPVVPRRVLVRFRSDVSQARISSLVIAAGAFHSRELSKTGVQMVEFPAGVDQEFFLSAFKAQPDVLFAELDYILAPAEMTPDDPSYPSQWHLPMISSGLAWDTTSGATGVIIAILDTGVDAGHPDLASRITAGWNCYDDNSDTTDVNGHGTAVAGTAAAAGNNSVGGASVAWGCQIMPVRISDPAGYASVSTIATGLTWAADNGAHIANVSYACTNFDTIKAAGQYFQSKGGVVTVAAGNDASYDSTADNPYVLTASATTSADVVASWSNRGANIDIAAPGAAIFTTLRGGGYGSLSGTSFSAPVTAGVAALVISANPSLNAGQVQTIVKQSANDLGTAGWDDGFGWGRVNAAQAVDRAINTVGGPDVEPPTVNMLSPGSEEPVSEYVIVEASVSDNIGVATVTLYLDGAEMGTYSEAPYSFAWDTSTASNGGHTLSATASDFAGNSSSASTTATVSNVVADAPPTIFISSPTENKKVAGMVSVMVRARDDREVTMVRLYVDGEAVATSTSAPFTTKWDAKKVKGGVHTLECEAYDASGNSTMSAPVTVNR